ncbi:hypothetical protein O6H91_07G114800 [Diphasiastrum complanatum]|uniref:Uncharacterized protein n=1 Tax=Diphasiastrum complanatum TaxID=34168 RepID=A0ACC2D8T7_DIPCM|nr:hypothetical protein O6H91_07G114800 [Diphasiastrum complanatum]
MGNCLGLCELFASPDRSRALHHTSVIQSAEGNLGRSARRPQHTNDNRRRKVSKSILGPITVLDESTDDVKLHYDLGPELGRGQFGVIRFCTNKHTGENFACKSIAKGRLCRQKDIDDIRREIQIMRQLVGQPNIVELKDVYEDHTWVHLVMELCEGGELFDSIVHKKVYSEKEAAAICKTLMEALAYCHKCGVIHRDLKPENILLAKGPDQTNVVKLADFGLAVNFRPGEKHCGMAGSAYYIAPEVLKGEYGEEADVWSAGVVLYILLSGVPPFWGDTEEAIFNAIKFGHLDLSSDPWPSVSAAAKDLIKGMLRQEIKKRLTPGQVLNHRWIVEHTQTKDLANLPASYIPVDMNVSSSWRTETTSFASFYTVSEVHS